MAWNQVTFLATQTMAEQLSDLLHNFGAVAITLKEGGTEQILEPLPGETPLWSDTQVVGLFEQDCDLNQVIEKLKLALHEDLPVYSIEKIADRAWERVWLQDFRPMQFGEKLWVVPSAYEPVDGSAVNIFLDPGMAFGTGTHATTALCLAWLDKNKAQDQIVIDYGCGSGILSIAAAKLGAKQVYAVDIDPQAVAATQLNAANNRVSNQIQVCLASEFDNLFGVTMANLLLANILANPLMTLVDMFADKLVNEGNVVLSGILQNQADDVFASYQQKFEMNPQKSLEGWVVLSGKKRRIPTE